MELLANLKDKVTGDPLAMAMWIAVKNPGIYHKLCRKCRQQYNKYAELAKQTNGDKQKIAKIGQEAMNNKFKFCPRCKHMLNGVKI
jgi:hypothetical protein